jgi:glyoxylase-like metal-dependent hydrolase (beta-lactamase superfamily II)
MKRITDGVHVLEFEFPGYPPDAIGVFLLGGVLIDSGIRQMSELILAQLEGHSVTAHAITHGHMDHQGSSHAVCAALGVPLWCPESEADHIESGDILPLVPDSEMTRQQIAECAGPGHPVARRLREGDEVGEFVVLETPGHSPGHVSYWRERDRVLIVGDAISNLNYETQEIGLHEPFAVFTLDPAQNRESIRRLAALEPRIACFGHGPAVRDPDLLHALADSLPAEVIA